MISYRHVIQIAVLPAVVFFSTSGRARAGDSVILFDAAVSKTAKADAANKIVAYSPNHLGPGDRIRAFVLHPDSLRSKYSVKYEFQEFHTSIKQLKVDDLLSAFIKAAPSGFNAATTQGAAAANDTFPTLKDKVDTYLKAYNDLLTEASEMKQIEPEKQKKLIKFRKAVIDAVASNSTNASIRIAAATEVLKLSKSEKSPKPVTKPIPLPGFDEKAQTQDRFKSLMEYDLTDTAQKECVDVSWLTEPVVRENNKIIELEKKFIQEQNALYIASRSTMVSSTEQSKVDALLQNNFRLLYGTPATDNSPARIGIVTARKQNLAGFLTLAKFYGDLLDPEKFPVYEEIESLDRCPGDEIRATFSATDRGFKVPAVPDSLLLNFYAPVPPDTGSGDSAQTDPNQTTGKQANSPQPEERGSVTIPVLNRWLVDYSVGPYFSDGYNRSYKGTQVSGVAGVGKYTVTESRGDRIQGNGAYLHYYKTQEKVSIGPTIGTDTKGFNSYMVGGSIMFNLGSPRNRLFITGGSIWSKVARPNDVKIGETITSATVDTRRDFERHSFLGLSLVFDIRL